jgi:hypothetical protein
MWKRRWSIVEYDRHTGRQTAYRSPLYWTSWGAWAERQRRISLCGKECVHEVAYYDRNADYGGRDLS